MKILKLLFIGIVFLFITKSNAQVSININIGSPPLWGPSGYTDVRYYYLPGVEAYYDIQTSMFIYYAGSIWVYETYLPWPYRTYDLYGGYKVVMTEYHGDTPYIYFKEHKKKYAKGYKGSFQKTIGEKPVKEKTHKGNDKNGDNNNSKNDSHNSNQNKNDHKNNGKNK